MTKRRDLEAITIKNYDDIAEEWSSDMAVVNDWEAELARFHHLLPEGKVLEIGCGGGRDARALVDMGYEYIGTDASSGMVRVAGKSVPDGAFKTLDMYKLGELNKKFDGFWACASILHIPKNRISEAMRSITGVLKPGAIGFISIKDGDKEDFEVRDIRDRHEERLFVYWQKTEFDKVLKAWGFEIVNYEYRPDDERTRWHIYFVKLRADIETGKN